MHHRGRHRRRGVLQLGERRAVGRGHLLGQRGLEDRHGLAELHRPALELAEHLEELLGGPGLHLGGHQLGRLAADPLADAEGGAPGEAEREARRASPCGVTALRGSLAHRAIVSCRAGAAHTADGPASAAAPPAATAGTTSSDTPGGTSLAVQRGVHDHGAEPRRHRGQRRLAGVTAGAGAGPPGVPAGQQRRPRRVAVAAVQVQAAQARPAAGHDQRPDEDPVALHDDRQLGHRPPQPRRAGLGGERPGRGQRPPAGATRAPGSWRRSRSSASAATGPASTRPTPPARSSEVRAAAGRPRR